MTNDIDRAGVAKAYAAWAPVYDMVFGKVFDEGRKSTIAVADAIGGRVLDVGVGTGLSLSDYSRSTKLHGVDISEPMLRKAQERMRRISRFRTVRSMRWWRSTSLPRCPIPKRRSMISCVC